MGHGTCRCYFLVDAGPTTVPPPRPLRSALRPMLFDPGYSLTGASIEPGVLPLYPPGPSMPLFEGGQLSSGRALGSDMCFSFGSSILDRRRPAKRLRAMTGLSNVIR